jgi:hypothetical protein
MKIYQSVQKISIDPLYLKPAMPLGRFCCTVKYKLWLMTTFAGYAVHTWGLQSQDQKEASILPRWEAYRLDVVGPHSADAASQKAVVFLLATVRT